MSVSKIEDHAKKIQRDDDTYYHSHYKCLHCGKVYVIHYGDFGSLRAHMRRKHRFEYSKTYIIDEETERGREFDLSLLRA